MKGTLDTRDFGSPILDYISCIQMADCGGVAEKKKKKKKAGETTFCCRLDRDMINQSLTYSGNQPYVLLRLVVLQCCSLK